MRLLLFIKLWAGTLARDRLLQEVLFCDDVTARETIRDFDEDRIINGENAKMETWPYIIRFGKKGIFPKHDCGGTYLGNGWVISAAHCFRRWWKYRWGEVKNVKDIMTFFGDYHWSKTEDAASETSFTIRKQI